MDRARELILRFGWNATAYQILNPGITHWFSSRVPALVGYVESASTLVVAGAPVCAPENLAAVITEFERHASRGNRRVCYVAAAARLENVVRDSPTHARITVGAQPVWIPASWPKILQAKPSLRAQLARARNKSVTISQIAPDQARRDPLVRRCIDDWLASRPLPPLHFLVEPRTLDGRLDDRICLLARRENEPVALLVASPIPQRDGYLIEQIARSPHAPNGTAELLIDALMHHLLRSDSKYLTMGLVPLSIHAQKEIQRNPLWLRALMAWARAHGQRFYHFSGLEAFRQKMTPDYWENIYIISNEPAVSPLSIHAMLSAFAAGSLSRVVFEALGSAVLTETRWLAQSIFGSGAQCAGGC